MKPLGVLQNISDGKNDEEYVTQYCGGLEDPRYEYEEGCDSIDIPYATEKCYCRTGTGWNIIFTLSDHYLHLRDTVCALSTLEQQDLVDNSLSNQSVVVFFCSRRKVASSDQSIAYSFQSFATVPKRAEAILSSSHFLSSLRY